jgi:hypothetical protein
LDRHTAFVGLALVLGISGTTLTGFSARVLQRLSETGGTAIATVAKVADVGFTVLLGFLGIVVATAGFAFLFLAWQHTYGSPAGARDRVATVACNITATLSLILYTCNQITESNMCATSASALALATLGVELVRSVAKLLNKKAKTSWS